MLIAFERGRLDLASHIRKLSEDDVFISTVTASELLHGVHRAQDENVRRERSASVEAVLAHFPIVAIDLEITRAHAALSASLAATGRLIGVHDMWLAATCIARGWSIATANLREFNRVEGLRVENWTK